jgi:hypothetical protein
MLRTKSKSFIVTVLIATAFVSGPHVAVADSWANELTELSKTEAIIDRCPTSTQQIAAHTVIGYARLAIDRGDTVSAANNMTRLAVIMQTCLSAIEDIEDHNKTCRGSVRIGMTEAEIRVTAWCRPTKVNRDISAGHVREQWVYNPQIEARGLDLPRGYLYLTDGILTAIQER